MLSDQTLPRGTLHTGCQTLKMDRHPGSISGNGRTISSVGGQMSTSVHHSHPDPVDDQTVSLGNSCTPTLVPNPVIGQTVLSGRGQTHTSVCHLHPNPDERHTVHPFNGQTATSVR